MGIGLTPTGNLGWEPLEEGVTPAESVSLQSLHSAFEAD